ncbi:SDR family oxidoreductase [Rathayibacter iranicus]|uniref:SDR family NAD(P)-dependent oxidoreductase n=2 Tax=Rathayibacter iranicus TaxID=59737 RepID=A0AAD1EM32_9MICO|nr:SDR family oxidoreductase [Rathayibacter iranicus]AZZ55320.1 SDR family NAD(P)-dependent oxidoreductase [Rathayibacter iranicus]MWV30955.1 NAD(P)H-binding protein [Rathayibacter iranicus NCPPB 2253 = VKM Ac-1602]PPI48108.1 NAD-dependent dehydratase [Rathayibacter iranicus]PPI61324.1 NAD-dependent dehydratase [Rathayibacter iranicus]PPI72731.1 NAD-dependent dehydratase [Rathayibacter iranicus]
MTRIAVIGAHGKVGQQILHLLYDAGHESVGVVRNPDHAEDILRLGSEPLVHDLEDSTPEAFAEALGHVDGMVFTAGAGPDSGPDRKRTVDLGASVLSQKAAAIIGVQHFVQISAMGVDEPLPEETDAGWKAYVEAKRDADAALRDSGVDWTILRPGGLTTDEGTGKITLGTSVEKGSIPRADVAATVIAVLAQPTSIGKTWEIVSGTSPIDEAVAHGA